MNKLKEFFSKKSTLSFVVSALVILGAIVFILKVTYRSTTSKIDQEYVSQLNDKAYGNDKVVFPFVNDKNGSNHSAIGIYYVISETYQSQKSDGSLGKIYPYGDQFLLDESLQIIEGAKPTGNYGFDRTGLVADSYYEFYQKVFPVNIDLYRKIPLNIKYQIIEQAAVGQTCNRTKGSVEADALQDAFQTSSTNTTFLEDCNPRYVMPSAPFVSENSIAYADLDNNPSTPVNALIIMQSPNGSGSACDNSSFILSVDANNNYYTSNVYSSICYVDKDIIKKGTPVEITKTTYNNSVKEVSKSEYILPSDAFVAHDYLDNLLYIIYDKTTRGQIKIKSSVDNGYSEGEYYD